MPRKRLTPEGRIKYAKKEILSLVSVLESLKDDINNIQNNLEIAEKELMIE